MCGRPKTFLNNFAQLEVTAFNELYEASRTWIREGELLVKGKATFDEYSASMPVTADEVFDFASARAAFAKQLEIACSAETVSVKKLAALLKPYCGGKCNTLIKFNNIDASATLRLSEDWQITLPDELLAELRESCGKDNVRIIYGD